MYIQWGYCLTKFKDILYCHWVLLSLLVLYRYSWGKPFPEYSRVSLTTWSTYINWTDFLSACCLRQCLDFKAWRLSDILAFTVLWRNDNKWKLKSVIKKKWFIKTFSKSILRYFFSSLMLSTHQYTNTMCLLEESN